TRSADDLLIVDCLLPSKVRRLGRRSTFLAPRQPIRTTAVDCRIRGGEYTQPDQASYATALEVWLPQAKAGDQEAQYYVGQIFEKGLGALPDFESAAVWYRRAAEQDYGAAQISLGYLYELGLGVDQDDVEALNWYRRAAGLAQDLVVLGEDEYQELLTARAELGVTRKEVETLELELEELRRQMNEIESQSEEADRRRSTLESVVERLEGSLAREKVEVTRREELIAELEKRLARTSTAGGTATPATGPPTRSEIDFGEYHALVIGNKAYQKLPELDTAVNDAREIAELLEGKYGFKVRLMVDATRYQTMTALNELRESLTREDNLLVYYAGHGKRDDKGETAYWQPVDADPVNPVNWIPSAVVTEHLDLVPAKHVFVVADSIYSGLRTRASIARLPRGMSDEERFHHIRLLLAKRARLVLTSGNSSPEAAGDQDHSRFSTALLSVLRDNDGVLEASKFYRELLDQLTATSPGSVPEFATMRWARNDIADFFFVPKS
ncbi:MAG: caspase family protein, partial [Thermoanaerobaculia bacterium]